MEIEDAPERNVHGFKGCRLKQEQLAMLQKKKPALLRAFLYLPTAVSATAKAKAYARPSRTPPPSKKPPPRTPRNPRRSTAAERSRSCYNTGGSDDSHS